MKNIRQRTLGFVLMGVGLVLIAVGVFELTRADAFKSVAKILLRRDESRNANQQPSNPKFISEEVSAILSDSILSNVVYRLELREKWGKKHFNSEPELRMERNQRVLETGKIKTAEAVRLMRERLEVNRVPNTTLLDIVFVSDDPDEAATIANMVAEVYRVWQLDRGHRLALGGIEALKAQIKIEDEKIKTAKEELQRLRKELSIPDAEVESASVRTNFPKYWNAKMNLERLNDFREMITRKKDLEEIDLKLPHSCSPVEIIEHAVPAKTPVRYHRRSGAMFVCVGFVLLGCSAVVLRKSNRAHP